MSKMTILICIRDTIFIIIKRGHIHLHNYCVIEVATILASLFMLYTQMVMYFNSIGYLKDWSNLFFIPFNAALFMLIKESRQSILEKWHTIKDQYHV